MKSDRLQKLELLQWLSSVGLFQISFASGVPVYPASIRCVAQWYPSGIPLAFQCTLDQPVYTGSG